MKLHQRIIRIDINTFWGENFVLKILGQKGKFSEKSTHGILLIFCIKLQQHKVLSCGENVANPKAVSSCMKNCHSNS